MAATEAWQLTTEDITTKARTTIRDLFTKYQIDDPSQAKRQVRERFTQADLDAYSEALHILDGSGELG